MSTVSTNFITYGLEYIIFNLTFRSLDGLTLRQTQHVQSGSFLDQTGQKQLAAGETQHLQHVFGQLVN